jgi:hypothetical protein
MAYATRRSYSGAAAACTLTSSVTSSDTSMTLTGDTTNWNNTANGSFYMVIDPGLSTEEKILVGARSSGSLSSITRGVDGTTAAAHSAGASCYPVFTAVDADQANAVASALTTKGDLLVTNGSALNRLAVGTNDYPLVADSSATNGVKWGQLAAAGIATDAVTTAKILDANVTAAKLATDAVTTAKIQDNAVTQAKMADRAIGSAELDNLTLNAVTDTYTLVLADAQKLVTLNKSTGFTVTIPPASSVAFETGDQVNLMQIGDGQITVAAGSGVTLQSQGDKKKLNGKWATATAVKIDTDTWVLIGNTVA